MATKMIRVLVVDDSAFARKVIREVLSRDPAIEVVGIARDGLEALERVTELQPDVITLDLVMPDLDGVGFLKALAKLSISPKVVVVTVSSADAELAIEALQLGAVDIVTKPTPLPTDRLYELSSELVQKVKAVALAFPRRQPKDEDLKIKEFIPKISYGRVSTELVVVGTSTGGPQALTQFFKMLPADFTIPIAVALHIPAGYTAPLAARISQHSAVQMVEAHNGLELKPGQAVIAPGGMHLRIKSREGRLYAEVSPEPLQSLYHPSVDILFKSAASSAGASAIGIILTGMGNDGTEGAKAIKDAGGMMLAESASSCVVYGMPRSVIEAGLSDAEAPIEGMVRLLLNKVSASEKSANFPKNV
jgi:two-component system chemotaxis response regulator CheB